MGSINSSNLINVIHMSIWSLLFKLASDMIQQFISLLYTINVMFMGLILKYKWIFSTLHTQYMLKSLLKFAQISLTLIHMQTSQPSQFIAHNWSAILVQVLKTHSRVKLCFPVRKTQLKFDILTLLRSWLCEVTVCDL